MICFIVLLGVGTFKFHRDYHFSYGEKQVDFNQEHQPHVFPIEPVRRKHSKKDAVDKDPGAGVRVIKKGPPKRKLDLDYLGEKLEPKNDKDGGNGDEVLPGAADGQGTKDELQKVEGQGQDGQGKGGGQGEGGQGMSEGEKGDKGVEGKGQNGGVKGEETRATNFCNLSHNKVVL